MTSVAFEFYTEVTPGIEKTWLVTADVSFEHGRSFAYLTSAHPKGEPDAAYDVSDLESALAEEANGRDLKTVEQAAIDAFAKDTDETEDYRWT